MEPAPRRGETPTPREFDHQISEFVGTFQSLAEAQPGSIYNPTTGRFTQVKRSDGTGQFKAEDSQVDAKKAAKLALAESKSLFRDIDAISTKFFPIISFLKEPTFTKSLELKDIALLNKKISQLKNAIEEAQKESNLQMFSKEFPGQEAKVEAKLKDFITEAKSQVELAQKIISTSTRIKIQGILNDIHTYGPRTGEDAEGLRRSFLDKVTKARNMKAVYKTRMDLRQNALETCVTDIKFLDKLLDKLRDKNQEESSKLIMAHFKALKELQTQKDHTIASLHSQIEQTKTDILQEEQRCMPEVSTLRENLLKFLQKSEPLRSLDTQITAAERRGDRSEVERLKARLAKDQGVERLALYKQWISEAKQKMDLASMTLTSPKLSELEERRIALEQALSQEQDSQGRLLLRMEIPQNLSKLIPEKEFEKAKAYVKDSLLLATNAADAHQVHLDRAKKAFQFYGDLVALSDTIGDNLEQWFTMSSGKDIGGLDYGTILALLRAREFFKNPIPEI